MTANPPTLQNHPSHSFYKGGKKPEKNKNVFVSGAFLFNLFFWHFCVGSIFQAQSHLTQTGTETEATDTLELQHLCYGQKLKQCYLENCGCWVK